MFGPGDVLPARQVDAADAGDMQLGVNRRARHLDPQAPTRVDPRLQAADGFGQNRFVFRAGTGHMQYRFNPVFQHLGTLHREPVAHGAQIFVTQVVQHPVQ